MYVVTFHGSLGLNSRGYPIYAQSLSEVVPVAVLESKELSLRDIGVLKSVILLNTENALLSSWNYPQIKTWEW